MVTSLKPPPLPETRFTCLGKVNEDVPLCGYGKLSPRSLRDTIKPSTVRAHTRVHILVEKRVQGVFSSSGRFRVSVETAVKSK